MSQPKKAGQQQPDSQNSRLLFALQRIGFMINYFNDINRAAWAYITAHYTRSLVDTSWFSSFRRNKMVEHVADIISQDDQTGNIDTFHKQAKILMDIRSSLKHAKQQSDVSKLCHLWDDFEEAYLEDVARETVSQRTINKMFD